MTITRNTRNTSNARNTRDARDANPNSSRGSNQDHPSITTPRNQAQETTNYTTLASNSSANHAEGKKEVENKWRFLTVPNMLSILRLIMLGPTVWALVTNRNLLAFILFVASSLTDAVDGWVARKFHQESEWGKILDPVADKLTLNVLGMILAFKGRIPLFLALVVLSRDSIILGGGLLLLTSKTYVPQSNLPGKITGFVFFGMICAGLLNARWLLDGFLVPVVTVLILITLVIYARNFLTKLRQRAEGEISAHSRSN